MTDVVNIRELVLDMLIEINEKEQYSHLVLRDVLHKYQYLEKQERAFLTMLTEGTMERLLELDAILNQFSSVKVSRMKPLIRNLLRMSVYQIRYMDRVPDSAVCNEAVKLAKKRGFGKLSGFVNGVLRNIARNGDQIVYPDKKTDFVHYLEIKYSVPVWLAEQWIGQFGQEKTEEILGTFGTRRSITIRTNLMRTTPEKLMEQLQEEQVTVRRNAHLPYALEIEGFDYLNRLQSFQEGKFYVQDISSMMVAEYANPKENDYIIDVCAAPGGKSTHLAEMMKGTGMVEARDVSEYKVAWIEENRKRHGLANMQTKVWDATVEDADSAEKADILICDLPCSGLGVIGKKTDIRYKMTKEKQQELVLLQRKILQTVHGYVKAGGTLVYSTCTIHQEENEGNVRWFLEQYPGFELEKMKQILPGEMGQDGFFIARFHRIK